MYSHKPIQLIIADDHMIMREGLASLLSDEPDMQILGLAETGAQAIHLIRTHKPHIGLMDITMEDMSGLEATRLLHQENICTKIIILTMHAERDFLFEALQVGASGYFLKGNHCKELLIAIRAVHQGGIYLPPQLAGELVQEFLHHHPVQNQTTDLSERETEILTLIAQGLTNSDIANTLTISINTVKSHRQRIYQKLNLNDRSSLVNYALKHGLLHIRNTKHIN